MISPTSQFRARNVDKVGNLDIRNSNIGRFELANEHDAKERTRGFGISASVGRRLLLAAVKEVGKRSMANLRRLK